MIIKALFVFVVCCYPAFFLVKVFIYDTYQDYKMYQIFELRDEIAVMAMSNQISEDNVNYRTLMTLINCEINILKRNKDSFSVTQYILNIIKPQTKNSYFHQRINYLFEDRLLRDYACKIGLVTIRRSKKYLRTLRLALKPFCFVLLIGELIMCHTVNRSKDYYRDFSNDYNDIQTEINKMDVIVHAV